MSHGIVQNSLGLYCPSVELSWGFPYILLFYPHVPACHLVPQSSYSPMGWTGLSMGFSHVPSWVYPMQCPVPSHSPVGWDWTVHGILTCPILGLSQCPVPSHSPVGWDGTVHGILTCPILKYTSKSQCPVPSHSPVGWTGLSMGFSHGPP